MKTAKKILIVDDDPLISRMYEKKLSNDGYRIETASDGEEGLAKAIRGKPDLILLDVMMPKMNGVETLKALQREPSTKNIPIFILTNLGDREEDIANAKKLGALDYLIKSQISLQELSQRVQTVVEHKP